MSEYLEFLEFLKKNPEEMQKVENTKKLHQLLQDNIKLADKLLAEGEIMSPEHYFNIIRTGKRYF